MLKGYFLPLEIWWLIWRIFPLELKKIRKIIKIVFSVLVLGIIVLLVISGICFRVKWEWIAEQFVVAVSTRDIGLLDELMDPNCEMYTTDNKNRVYSHYQRGVIENLWCEETYNVTSYESYLRREILDPEIFCWLKNEVVFWVEMKIVDKDGKEYDLSVWFLIEKLGLFDAKIVETWAQLY